MSMSSIASKYIGVVENSSKHHKIIDTYNKIVPLPRGYKMTYRDSWCAAFVSVIMKKAKVENAPFECSANNMLIKCRKTKRFTKTPKVNDIVFYSWRCNGYCGHVGIISKIDDDVLTVIEGNKSNRVGVRTIKKSSQFIIGYGEVE